MRRYTINLPIWTVILSIFTPSGGSADTMTPELLWKLGRLQGGVISPDGTQVAYAVRRYELEENKGTSSVQLVSMDRGERRVLADGLSSVSDLQWVLTTSGPRLYLITTPSGRDEDDQDDEDDDADGEDEEEDTGEDETKPQVWSLGENGDLSSVTDVEQGVSGFKVSPDGSRIAFTARVKLAPTIEELYADLPKANAQIIDSLMFRHWNDWNDGTYSHLHVARLDADGKAGDAIDLMENLRFECPVPPFAGSEQFAWSPDGKEIAFTSKMVSDPAESTDTDIYLIDVTAEKKRTRCITAGMDGYDVDPRYSPDGGTLAFHSMERAGFESDRNRVLLYDRGLGTISEVTTGLDQTAHDARWSPDGRSLYFYSEHRGTNQIFRLEVRTRTLRQVSSGRYNWSLRDISPGGDRLLVARQSMLRPYELVRLAVDGSEATTLTDINGDIYDDLELPTIEERWVRSTDGQKVHNWVIYPPDFDPEKTWPMLTYCQGGPQGQIGQWFSYRWNFHLMAARGYVVLAVNRRGLPGFGRAWNDQISGDWGGQAMQDILAATDSMLTERFIDHRKVAAIGASFGGYTVYWLMGNHRDRFAAMIAHCGVFNLESMYGSTEELFFVNWDLGGPYWQSSEVQRHYDRFSPHRFVKRWRTPLLVIHGEKDFRVPLTQGIEAFTAAQVQGVPSRFLYFPTEGHWVLGPQNGVLWHRVFFEWLGRYCK